MKSNKYIDIDFNTPIIIYGAAGNGLRGYHALKVNNNYNVIGFFDIRADEIRTQFGLPVWNLDSNIPYEKSDVVVCICIKNVYEHPYIVNNLIDAGYKYIIYKALSELTEDSKIINNNYDKIFNDDNTSSDQFTLSRMVRANKVKWYEFKDYATIGSCKEYVLVSIPIEMIFVKTSGNIYGLKSYRERISSLCLSPHIKIANSILGKNDTFTEYIDFCIKSIKNSEKLYGIGGGKIEDTIRWRSNIINSKIDIFNKMNEIFELERSFFVKHAPLVNLEDGVLHIVSAKHRLAFFLAKEMKYLPVKILKSEYEKFLRKESLKKLIEYLQIHSINIVNIPILHPFFYKYKSRVPFFYENFFRKIIFYLSNQNLNNIYIEDFSVCTCIDDDGMTGRLFKLVGFGNIKVVVDDIKYSKLLDELYGVNNLQYLKYLEEADIIFCNDDNYDMIQRCLFKYCFVISEKNSLIVSDNFQYWKLSQLIWNGRIKYCYVIQGRKV